MALFQHCSVLFELKGLPFKEKKKIKLAVTDNGGKISFLANKECSLIVTSDVSSLSPGRIRNIVKHQIPVVGLNYVQRCVEADCRLPVEDFKLDVSSTNDLPAACKDPKEKWSGSTVTSAPSKGQAKPLKTVSATQRAESPMEQRSVIENYKVYNERDSGLPKFPESFQVAKYSLFQKSNGQSWCLLELQSAKSESGRKYRVVRYWMGDIQSKKAAVRDQMVFVSTSEEAVKVFQALSDSVKADGLKQKSHGPPQVTEMGSAPLQQLLLEEKLHTGALSTEVGQFVELLWQEALGCIDLILNTPVHKISLNDVTRAEGLLLQVQRKILENKNDELSLKSQCVTLLNEYCTLLPQRSPVGPDMSSISKQFDICQIIRDILNVSEMTLGSTVPSSVGKYRALRCSIEAVPKGSSEFEAVTSLLQHSKVQVHQILRVDRAPELQSFKRELGNIKPLLHSSRPHNFVGILSRGLLMPCVAVSQHGIQRTDAGDLGSGIYFSDDINTTLKYSQCSLTDGSRLMLVCDVALGRCKDYRKKDLTLSQAPEGHDSVHGVRNAPGLQSEFMDNEYVVYSPDQVKLKYVVRLSSQGDELKSFTPGIVQSDEPLSSPPDQGVTEIEDGIVEVKNPLDNVTAGLLNSSGQQIPLQAVHVKCKLVDLLAQVIIFQKYTNESSMPIEAKYVFPLDDSAAVCGFDAFINGKHVVGQVKEKETARREYKQAIEKGHGAYLMDQDAPDVFTISVGNLPPGATVLIKVTFVSELIVKDGSIFFSLPSSVAPWQESAALNQTTQVTVEKVCVTDEGASTREFNLDMSIEMPHQITEVKCVTHQVKLKKTDCKAVVSVLPGEVMGPEGFQLLVTLTEVHVPRMWVEQHPNKDSQACMLVFYPNFEAASRDKSDEVVLLLDASQSMKGESLNSARMIALQILKTLDHNVSINVIFFGTDHTEAFLSAKPIDEARPEAKNFIKHFSSSGGSTELWRPLRALSLLPPSSGTRNLLLLSDGHIQNTELTLQLLRDNAPHTRLFTCGLSPTANRHMLRALAQAGGGAYEFFDSKSKHTWSEKVGSQVKRLQAPGASSVSVKWQQFNPTAPPPVQAPKQLHALFNDCHTLVFGFVPHCTKATLLGNLSGQEIETMVSTSELQKTKGTFLHKLTARAIIRDFEDGSLDSNAVLHEEKKAELKSFVIELSKEFSVLSQFTSFVAIEERESDEEKGFTDIPKLIAEEDVDFLPYMSWASTEDFDEEESYEQESSPDSVETPDNSLMEDSIIESLSTSEDDDMGFSLMDFPSPPLLICKRSSESLPEPVDSLVTPTSIEVFEGIMTRTSAPCAMPPPPPPPSRPSVLVESAAKKLRSDPCNLASPRPSPTYLSDCGLTPVEQDEDMACLEMSSISPAAASYMRRMGHTISAAQPPPPPSSVVGSTLTPVQRLKKKSLKMSPVSAVHMELDSKCSSFLPPYFASSLSAPHALRPCNAMPSLPKKQMSFSFGSQFDQTPPPPSSLGMAAPPPISMRSSSPSRAVRQTNAMRPPPVPERHRTSRESNSSAQTPSPLAQRAMAAPPAPDILQQQEVPYLSYSQSYSGLFGSAQTVMDPQIEHAKPQSDQRRSFLSRSESGVPGGQRSFVGRVREGGFRVQLGGGDFEGQAVGSGFEGRVGGGRFQSRAFRRSFGAEVPVDTQMESEATLHETTDKGLFFKKGLRKSRGKRFSEEIGDNISKWPEIFSLQNPEGYWELTPKLGMLLNCDVSRFADDFLRRKGIASLGEKAHADILKLLATLLVLQLMRLEKIRVGQLLRTLFCLEDNKFRSDHWEAVNRAVEWARWADRQYPCVYSRLEFGLSWDSSTKQLLGVERIHHCSPLTGLNLNPRPTMVL